MTEENIRRLLRRRIGSWSMRDWSRKEGVNPSHVSEFLNGKRGPAADVLNALGLEYRIVRKRQEFTDTPPPARRAIP